MNHSSTNTSFQCNGLPGEGLSLPFQEGATQVAGDPPSPELANNPRYRVVRDFYSNILDNQRDIRLYLPEAYLADPERRFPVFYLHDGQNLFDGRTSYVVNHTWRAHTTADELTRRGIIEPVILVGIDNTGVHRMSEYTPTRDSRMGGGEGPRYGRFLLEELKPVIDHTLRTLSGHEHTGLGGSSLGGLISLSLGLDYPDVFGQLAVLSPSVWWDQRSILTLVRTSKPRPRIWLDMGTSEGLRHLRDCDVLHHRLEQKGWRENIDMRYLRIAGGLHNEDAWASRFGMVLEFLFRAAG